MNPFVSVAARWVTGLCLALIAGMVGVSEAIAQTVNWTNGATTYDWNTGGNWSTSALPTTSATAAFSNATAGVAGTVTQSGTANAAFLYVTAAGYTISNNGSNFLVLNYNNSTGSSTTDAFSSLWVSGNNTFNIGTGSDSTVVKLNGNTTSYSNQVLLGSGSGATRGTLNINAGATLMRDNSGGQNGGMRFVGSGTTNLYGTVSLLVGNDGIRISERDNDTITFNVKSGGVMTANTTATNESNGSIWVAGGAAGAGAGLNMLTVESGGLVTVVPNASNAFGLTRNAGPTSLTTLSGTIVAPRVISLASTGTLSFAGGTLKANAANGNFITSGSFVGGSLSSASGGTIDNGGYTIGIGVGIGGAGSMTFAGSGATTLTGTHTYAGATNVNAGTLIANGSLASNVVVASGASLNGSGTTSGSVTFNAGSYLSANTNGSKFTGNGVTFSGQTLLQFNGAVTTGSTYDVVVYGVGGVTSLGNLVSTARALITDDVANSKVTATAQGVATETWGGGSGTWSIGGSNWSGTYSNFYNGDTAQFTTGSGGATVTLSNSLGTLLPAAVNVTSDTDYEFAGSGAVGGTGALTKAGSGALTLSTANSYSGGTVLNAGRINVNNAGAIGSGTVGISGGSLGNTSGGAVTLTGAPTQSWSGDFSYDGPDSLNMGNGRVTLGGSGTRTITVSSGTLTVGGLTGTSVSGTLGFTKAGPGTLTLNPTAISGALGSAVGDLTVSDGTLNMGAFDLTTTGLSGSGTIANGSNTTRWLFSVVASGTKTFDGSLRDGGGTGRLGVNVSGGGTQVINGDGSWSDTTTINGATTKLVLNGVNTGTSYTDLVAGPTLQFGNPAAIAAGSRVNLNGAQTATIIYATDGGDNAYAFGGSSNSTYNIVLDRATPGTDVTHPMSSANVGVAGFGGGTLSVNFTRGSNVSGTATASFDQFNLGGGSGGSTTVNPAVGTVVTIGTVTKSLNNTAQTLVLDGVTAGNQVTGAISNGVATSVALTKSNSSTWTLSGNSTYTGATSILGGTLVVNGDNSAANGGVSVAGGTLGGTGILGGAITVDASGVLAPGASIGTLTGNQSVTLNNGSTLGMELNTSVVAGDLVKVVGGINLAGTVTLTLSDLATSTAVPNGTVLSLVNYGGTWNSGLFTYNSTLLSDGDTFTLGANDWKIEYASTLQGSNVTSPVGGAYINLTAVPEPSVMAAGLCGLLSAIAMARRRRS